jgi:hypothetical protein
MTVSLTSTGSVDHIGAAQTEPTSYKYVTPEFLETDPSTGSPWTPSGLSDTLFGAKF